MVELVGRIAEKTILQNALKSKQAELLVVFGRRRIGKTFLIRTIYKNYIKFELSGILNESYKKQLQNFYQKLVVKTKTAKLPHNWIAAFFELEKYLNRLKSSKKKVVFIDEFPWLDTHKSGFLSAFDNFWNSYVSKRDDLIVVICGSAASYMVKKIINNKGGLHNRLTQIINLEPFTLYEAKQLLKKKNIKFSNYEIVQLYMVFGGVPHYLQKIEKGESITQTIDKLCFKKNGFLRQEFNNIFASLFNEHDNHYTIVRILAKVRKGLTRGEIENKSKVKTGGTLTKTLSELEESGFIEKYLPYKGNKDALFRLSDEYAMFYLKFIENTPVSKKSVWQLIQARQTFKIWCGFTFETICLKHVEQIKEALKISGTYSVNGSWIEKRKKNNAQIDLLIDRDDNVINLCEMKFYNTTYTINKKYAHNIANKVNSFVESTKTQKSIFVTFITTYGLVENQYSNQHVQNELTVNDLFIEI